MTHNVEYYDYPKSTSLKEIFKGLDTYVRHQTYLEGGSGIDNIRTPTDKIFDTRVEAEEYIESVDNGWYDQIAVQYRASDKISSTKIDEFRRKISETYTLKNKLYNESISSRKSAYIGCLNCGSKINKDYIETHKCPVCGISLLSETTKNRIAGYEAKIKQYKEKIVEEQKKVNKKADVRWLVKIEYHT